MDQEQRNDPFPAAPEGQKSNLSMMVGVGAFIIVLAGLGWYVYSGMPTQEIPVTAKEKSDPLSTTTNDAAAAALSAQGTSDETAAIESDLRATNLDSLGEIDKI